MRRQLRTILPFTGGNRVLRFSGRSRSSNRDGGAEPRDEHSENELYRALGRIAANWSLIEIASGMVLMSLVGSRDEAMARAVVAGQRVENVWETVEALLASFGDDAGDVLAEFRLWRRSANKCRRRRNEAIHSAWSLTTGSGDPAAWDVMSQKAKRGARADLFPGGITELEELARGIADLEDRLTEVHMSVLDLMDRRDRNPPSPSVPPGAG
jgi:hypothetical protein